MKPSPDSKNTLDPAVPKSDAVRNLSENEKKALELEEYAERESGQKRKHLQDEAHQKAKEAGK